MDPGESSFQENPQSWNEYAYVRNNPLTLLDPDGAEPVVHSDAQTYDVQGNSASEAWANATAANADGFPGHTSWNLGVTDLQSMESASADLGIAVSIPTSVTVTVNTTTTLPKWTAPAGAAPGEQQKFDAQKGSCAEHEKGHVEIAKQGGRALESTVKGSLGTGQGANAAQANTNARNNLVQKANDARAQQAKKTDQKQKAYDNKTDHGRKKP